MACAGSRVITGVLEPDRARGLTDADGMTMADALRKAGREPDHLGPDPEVLRRIGAFVELHVEQGRGLVDLESPSPSAPTSGPTAAGASTSPVRPTTRAPRGSRIVTTRCSASPSRPHRSRGG